jgi:hypothetical protein
MVDWINNGIDHQIIAHTWLDSEPGNVTTAYNAMKNKEGQVVLIVIFNQTCDDNPNDKPECKDAAHVTYPIDPGETDIVVEGSSKLYFHVVGFGAFYVTCVHEKNSDKCPGYERALELNPSIKNSVNSIEGYFVSEYPFPPSDTTGGGVDMGIYIVSLTK